MAKKKVLDLVDFDARSEPNNNSLSPGPGKNSRKLASYWKESIEKCDKANANWHRRGASIIRRFKDERGTVDTASGRKMNLLWANVKSLKPALYSKCPIPIVDRKFLDKDVNGRLSSRILERSTKNEIESNGYHKAISRSVTDYLLPGRGIVWVRYEPEFGGGVSIPADNPDANTDDLDKILKDAGAGEESNEVEALEGSDDQLIKEKTPVDYIHWKDFYTIPANARTWEEVQAIGKKVHISKEEAKEIFAEEIAKELRPDTVRSKDKDRDDNNQVYDLNERNIVIYEIWNKSDKRVYWVNKGYDFLCNVVDDPLKLPKFFPVPEPISATITNESLIPVPDYHEYQDQAIQIDELTHRIALLTKACRIAGTYDSSNSALSRVLDEDTENKLIPVPNWAMFAEKGGVKGGISFLPLEEIQTCIRTLQEVRQSAMTDLDRITGINDIFRGTTDSRETLGGLRLKNNNTGTRLSERQSDIANYAKEVVQIVAEIIAIHFSDKALIKSSGILFDEELQPAFILEENKVNQPVESVIPQMPPMPSPAPMPCEGIGRAIDGIAILADGPCSIGCNGDPCIPCSIPCGMGAGDGIGGI